MTKKEQDGQSIKEEVPAQAKKTTGRKRTGGKAAAGKNQEEGKSGAGERRTGNKEKNLYRVTFFYEWCKSCGICSALCPKSIILLDEQGRPYLDMEDDCIGCRNCEIHCPDFAITVKKRHPERRKTNGTR